MSLLRWSILASLAVFAPEAAAHGVPEGDLGYLQATDGVRLGPFAYLGAKHMVTGYDHLLFLLGVLFFLYRFRDVALYTALFAVGHSVTMLAGVLLQVQVNAYLVDAVIGLSVAYKALDNLGTLDRWLGFRPDPRAAVLAFGLVHGLGLATKVLEFDVGSRGSCRTCSRSTWAWRRARRSRSRRSCSGSGGGAGRAASSATRSG